MNPHQTSQERDDLQTALPQNLKASLCAIENGRFKEIVEALAVDDICGQCGYFVPGKTAFYRCNCLGTCIAATLSPKAQAYMLKSIGIPVKAAP